MSKVKTFGTIALSIFAITFLYQVFSKGFTNQDEWSKSRAEESQARLRELDKAFADSRAASEALSKDSSVSETKASSEAKFNENSSFRFPQSSCGDKSTGGDDSWYPVFVNGGDLEDIRGKFCSDAVAVTRKNTGVKAVLLASFTSRVKAVEFAQAVSGEVGEPTVSEANSSDEPSQPASVEVSPNEPTVSEVEVQQQQTELQQRQVEQVITEAKNLCHQKWIEEQKKVNKIREANLGSGDNYMADFTEDIAKNTGRLAKAELGKCLLEAQSQQIPATPE
jgi:hypothetical protein